MKKLSKKLSLKVQRWNYILKKWLIFHHFHHFLVVVLVLRNCIEPVSDRRRSAIDFTKYLGVKMAENGLILMEGGPTPGAITFNVLNRIRDPIQLDRFR